MDSRNDDRERERVEESQQKRDAMVAQMLEHVPRQTAALERIAEALERIASEAINRW